MKQNDENLISNCTGVILCGGNSSRMGFDKIYIEFDGNYLLEEINNELKNVFKDIILVADRSDKFDNMRLNSKIIEDIYSECGPLGGIYTALENINTEYAFITACDMPLIDINLIRDMHCKLAKYDVLIGSFEDKIEPMYAFYSIKVKDIIMRQMDDGNYSIRGLFNKILLRKYPLTRDEIEIFTVNLNTKEDIEKFKKDFRR